MANDHVSQATGLVDLGRKASLALYSSIGDDFPEFKAAGRDDWEFFGTVAAVWTALSQMGYLPISKPEKQRIFAIVQGALASAYPDALAALDDCEVFMVAMAERLRGSSDDDNKKLAHGLGLWLFANVFRKEALGEQDAILVSVLGGLVASAFGPYWSTA